MIVKRLGWVFVAALVFSGCEDSILPETNAPAWELEGGLEHRIELDYSVSLSRVVLLIEAEIHHYSISGEQTILSCEGDFLPEADNTVVYRVLLAGPGTPEGKTNVLGTFDLIDQSHMGCFDYFFVCDMISQEGILGSNYLSGQTCSQ